MYTKDFSKLIYWSPLQEDFIFKLKIHHSIINNNSIYLNKYIYSNQFIEKVENSNMNIEDIITMLKKDKLEVKGKKINIRSEDGKDIKSFNSIKDCIQILNTVAASNKTTLYRYIDLGCEASLSRLYLSI